MTYGDSFIKDMQNNVGMRSGVSQKKWDARKCSLESRRWPFTRWVFIVSESPRGGKADRFLQHGLRLFVASFLASVSGF